MFNRDLEFMLKGGVILTDADGQKVVNKPGVSYYGLYVMNGVTAIQNIEVASGDTHNYVMDGDLCNFSTLPTERFFMVRFTGITLIAGSEAIAAFSSLPRTPPASFRS